MRALIAYKKDCKIERLFTEEEKEIQKERKERYEEGEKKIKVRRAVLNPKQSKSNQKKRGRIKSFSKETQKRIKFFMNNNDIAYESMITLTYPIECLGKDGKEIKYHLNRFTKRWNLNNYIWVLEFQKNGNPHFHILTDNKYKNKDNEIISQIWYEIVGSGLEKHLWAGTRNEKLRNGKAGATSYIRKYVNKKDQKKIPKDYKNCGKLWGKGGKENKLRKEIISIDEDIINTVKEIYLDKLNEEFKKKEGINPKMFDCIEKMEYPILWNMTKEIL